MAGILFLAKGRVVGVVAEEVEGGDGLGFRGAEAVVVCGSSSCWSTEKGFEVGIGGAGLRFKLEKLDKRLRRLFTNMNVS